MEELAAVHAAAIEVFDQIPFGLVLLDDRARVLFSNHEARRILLESEAIGKRGGRLRATVASQDVILQRLIQLAATPTPAAPGAANAAGALSGLGRGSVQFLVSRLKASASVAVFITDASRRSAPTAETLRACFGFSPAEARLVRELLDGRSVKEAAAQLLLTENTVRGYLKTVLAKTGCRSQTALMAFLLRSVTAIRAPSPSHGKAR